MNGNARQVSTFTIAFAFRFEDILKKKSLFIALHEVHEKPLEDLSFIKKKKKDAGVNKQINCIGGRWTTDRDHNIFSEQIVQKKKQVLAEKINKIKWSDSSHQI